MEMVWNKYQLHKNRILPMLGVLAVAVLMLPYVLLGKGSYIQIHDQVDGEILNYIYQAKYLWKGSSIPEFMNGMSKAAMTAPAPFGVLLYVVFPPFVAFLVMQWFVVLMGFLGMYYLCKRLGMLEEISFVVAILFSFLPFYPTYGLAALGQPLLVLCFWELLCGKKRILPLLGILLYAGFSSLTLVGYVWVGIGVVLGVVLTWKKQPVKGYWLGWCILLITYLLTNLELFSSLLGKGFTTHREEMVLTATSDLWGRFRELFFVGGSYSGVYSVGIFVVTVALLLYGWLGLRKQENRQVFDCIRIVSGLLALIVVLTLCAVLWNSQMLVELRKALGGMFTYFQADRVYWIFPFLWMLLLAFVLQILYLLGKGKGLWLRAGLLAAGMALLAVEGVQIFRDSNFNKNLRLLLVDGYEQVTWESLYMEKVFDRIDEVIGEEKQEYSVVSLGIYPSVALYNGYTCADGYSNNYDLAYKHAFRELQGEELEKNPEVLKYFDDWGNRLYLISAEYGFNAMVGKAQGMTYRDLAYDMDTMQKLNIRYVFAAASVEDAEEMGWTLVEGSPFESESSFYEVWVYRLEW